MPTLLELLQELKQVPIVNGWIQPFERLLIRSVKQLISDQLLLLQQLQICVCSPRQIRNRLTNKKQKCRNKWSIPSLEEE